MALRATATLGANALFTKASATVSLVAHKASCVFNVKIVTFYCSLSNPAYFTPWPFAKMTHRIIS